MVKRRVSRSRHSCRSATYAPFWHPTGVAIGAAIAAGSVALLGFGLDSGIEAMASIIVIWRFTGDPAGQRHL